MKTWSLVGLILIALALSGCAPPAASPTAAAAGGSTGTAEDLYPPQDLSIIAKTNRVQFLNVYANW